MKNNLNMAKMIALASIFGGMEFSADNYQKTYPSQETQELLIKKAQQKRDRKNKQRRNIANANPQEK